MLHKKLSGQTESMFHPLLSAVNQEHSGSPQEPAAGQGSHKPTGTIAPARLFTSWVLSLTVTSRLLPPSGRCGRSMDRVERKAAAEAVS